MLICNNAAPLDEELKERGRCYHNNRHTLQNRLTSSWYQACSMLVLIPELRFGTNGLAC
jgi:hypothetical protein